MNIIDKYIEQTKEEIQGLRDTSIKLPKKPFKLKEEVEEEDLSKMNAREIYIAGMYWEEFDYKKGFDELIKKDKGGENIYNAGIDWKEFDFDKGFNELIKKDKYGQYIYYAGKDWNKFNYKKGMEALKNNKYYLNLAKKNWPKGIEQSKQEIQKLRDTSIKLPKKPFKL